MTTDTERRRTVSPPALALILAWSLLVAGAVTPVGAVAITEPDGATDDPVVLLPGGRGDYKPAWTTLDEVRANAVRTYPPGEEGR